MSIKNLLQEQYRDNKSEKIVQVRGWLLSKRSQKEITFIIN